MIVLHSFLDKPREKKQFVLHGSVVGCRCNEKRSPKNHCVYLLMVELSPLELSSLQPLSRGKDSIMEFHDQMWSNDNFNHCNTKVTNIKSASTFLLACFGVICSHHFGLSVKPFKNGVPRFPVVSTTETAMVFVTVSAGYTAAAALAGVATIAELSRATSRSVLAPRYLVVRGFFFWGGRDFGKISPKSNIKNSWKDKTGQSVCKNTISTYPQKMFLLCEFELYAKTHCKQHVLLLLLPPLLSGGQWAILMFRKIFWNSPEEIFGIRNKPMTLLQAAERTFNCLLDWLGLTSAGCWGETYWFGRFQILETQG